MHTHTKPLGQRKVSPPGPTFMSNDQMGMRFAISLAITTV